MKFCKTLMTNILTSIYVFLLLNLSAKRCTLESCFCDLKRFLPGFESEPNVCCLPCSP